MTFPDAKRTPAIVESTRSFLGQLHILLTGYSILVLLLFPFLVITVSFVHGVIPGAIWQEGGLSYWILYPMEVFLT